MKVSLIAAEIWARQHVAEYAGDAEAFGRQVAAAARGATTSWLARAWAWLKGHA